MAVQAVILAAGEGKRMQSNLAKVLHHLAGEPLITHVLNSLPSIANEKPAILLYGYNGQQVQLALANSNCIFVEQKEQLGTGHALQQALPYINPEDRVLILYGDVPLVNMRTLTNLIVATPKDALGMLTATLENPMGYGRIVRNVNQKVVKIVEEKEANNEEKAITEVNSGIYVIPAAYLARWLPKLNNQNAQKEYYLTDVIALAVSEQIPIHTVSPETSEEIFGVNDKVQLAYLEHVFQQMQAKRLLEQGVTLIDPDRVYVRNLKGEPRIGKDVTIDIDVILAGEISIDDNCVIGPYSILCDVQLGKGVEIKSHCVLEETIVHAFCTIGPYARLRPGTELAEKVHVGNFVEIKKTHIGERTKINHLSYIGDSQVGFDVNIGAGTITCNYDGVNKHKTIIGNRVMVGSDTTFVAPITIHDDAYIATATTVRHDVPAGALVFNKREENIREGWVAARNEKMNEEKSIGEKS